MAMATGEGGDVHLQRQPRHLDYRSRDVESCRCREKASSSHKWQLIRGLEPYLVRERSLVGGDAPRLPEAVWGDIDVPKLLFVDLLFPSCCFQCGFSPVPVVSRPGSVFVPRMSKVLRETRRGIGPASSLEDAMID
ncbi:hypothetical protein R1sor_007957 [Riccia sorocarpa]|uniref:Uncharacterized protein n=1 Tax=Riccia sorocarpa TaxID=122646 RepID=A0ABD3HTN8_9MARC